MPWFDCAVRRPIGANTGGMLSPNLGLVLHHAVANGSLWGFFNNPAAQVSAHFWVSKSGVIEQYVDTNVVAWHGRQLNTRYVGVETEGCTSPPAYAEPMTEAMINALSRIYAEGIRRHGWHASLANRDGENGFGYHRMAVNTACPCDVRLNMRTEIIAQAVGGKPTPPPQPVSVGGNMIASDPTSGGNWWVDSRDGHVETFGGAPYLGGLNESGGTPVNNPKMKHNVQQIGVIDGIAAFRNDGEGGWGYVISVQRKQADGSSWVARYLFRRNGKDK